MASSELQRHIERLKLRDKRCRMKAVLNILHLVTSLGRGGRRYFVAQLVQNLEKSRFCSTIACVEKKGCEAEFIENVPCKIIECWRGDRLNPKVLWRLWRSCLDLKIDIVHAHDGASHFYGSLAGRLAGSRMVYTFHRGDAQDVGGVKNALRNRLPFALTNAVVTVSNERANFLADASGLPRQSIMVIPNGVNCERFREAHLSRTSFRDEIGIPHDAIVFGSIGALEPIKGMDIVVRAFIRLAVTRRDCWLVIVGEGRERDGLALLASQAGVGDRVKFTGYREDVNYCLGGFDVFVLGSRHESFGRVIVEAMASGLPVVASNVGGIPDSVVNKTTGLLVASEDVEAFSASMCMLTKNESVRSRMGELGQERARTCFGLMSIVRQYEVLYEKVIVGR